MGQQSFAVVFPGQGSQSVGMLAELAQNYPIVTQSFEQASDILGYNLWDTVSQGPIERLSQTEITQPAMLVSGVAVWRVWQQQQGAMPSFMAGHSLGEYTALVCAEAMSFDNAITVVAARGRLMQAAVPVGQGAMAAILGLEEGQVETLVQQASQDQVVEAVNFNAIGQVVIAGNTPAVERAVELAKQAGAKRAKLLPVSVPSHCRLMQEAAIQLQDVLQSISIQTPQIKVIHNVDVQSHTDPKAIHEALVKQLYQPVQWVQTIQSLKAQNIDIVIEAGPGKVLSGLNKRIDKTMTALPIFDSKTLETALEAVK